MADNPPYKVRPVAADGPFDYHTSIDVETGMVRSRDAWIRPTGGASSNQMGPWLFEVPPMVENEYLDGNNVALETTCRIVKSDGTQCKAHMDIVAPVNLLAIVMWKEANVTLNQRPLPNAAALHVGLKGYMETLLTFDEDAAVTHLASQMFHLDSPGEFDNMTLDLKAMHEAFAVSVIGGQLPMPAFPDLYYPPDGSPVPPTEALVVVRGRTKNWADVRAAAFAAGDQDMRVRELDREDTWFDYFDMAVGMMVKALQDVSDKVNKGYVERYRVTRSSDLINMYGPVPHDFFNMDKFIGPGNKIDLRLVRYPDEVLLNTYLREKGYKLEILDIQLHLPLVVRRQRVPPSLIETYRINISTFQTQLVDAGKPSFDFRLQRSGVLPKTIVVGMVETRALDGDYEYNPLHFHHFLLNQIYLTVNGRQYPDMGGLHFDFDRPDKAALMARSYRWLFENTGAGDADRGNLIHANAFRAGSCLIPFDLTPDRQGPPVFCFLFS